jgi:hypothetical protein
MVVDALAVVGVKLVAAIETGESVGLAAQRVLNACQPGAVQGAQVRQRLVQRPFACAPLHRHIPTGFIQGSKKALVNAVHLAQILGQCQGIKSLVHFITSRAPARCNSGAMQHKHHNVVGPSHDPAKPASPLATASALSRSGWRQQACLVVCLPIGIISRPRASGIAQR